MAGAIHLVPFGELNPRLAMRLAEDLRNKFNREIVVDPKQPLPQEGYDAKRRQYLAGAFLTELRRRSGPNGSKFLGVTEPDLFSPGLNFIFGQAEVGGTAAVISLARLIPHGADVQPEELLRRRALKEAVHELGHTFGLEHCRDRHCVMFFSSGLADTDVKSPDFCLRHSAAQRAAALTDAL
jgi:archaemetzincin